MDLSSQPEHRPSLQSVATATATINSLSDDILADILVRLPSQASLGRAALACRRWLRLATSRDFLSRYRALHPSSPPLIGCFISFAGRLPVFHRVPELPDPDLAAAARGGDFMFTSFTDGYQWSLEDCRGGPFLLANREEDELALFDPVSRRRVRIPIPCEDYDDVEDRVFCLLPSCGGDEEDNRDASFRVASLELSDLMKEKMEADEEEEEVVRVRANVYSHGTGEWRPHPWAPPLGDYDYNDFSSPPMHAAGRVYWKKCRLDANCKVLLSLNTETMEFS